MAAQDKIFISYRRADVGGYAVLLFKELSYWFDRNHLFYDLDAIESGDVFPDRIADGIGSAAVILVLIGPDWLREINRRVAEPGIDFVRREVELALQRHADGALVIPVLNGGTAMPSPASFHTDLQAALAPLCAFDAHEFKGKQADWDAQFVRLRERIAQVPGVPAPRFRLPTGVEQPFRVIERDLARFRDPNNLLPRLREQLTASGSAAVLARAALYGMGGVGKTQLALKYCHEYRDRYAGVWWLRAETETTLQLDAKDCCDAMSAPINDGEAPTAALKRWLERQKSTWLLVFDNAESVDVLRLCLPQASGHHVIVTSRNPAWGGIAQPVELETWTTEQGADFLAARLPGTAHSELLHLADNLGGLPLALEQAASYIDETGVLVAEYRVLLTGTNTEGLVIDEGRAATGYERSVAATLSLAFDKLSTAATQLLRLLAFAAPEPFAERFFKEAREHLPAELADAAANPLAWNQLVGELRSYGLAERENISAIDRPPGEDSDHSEQALSLHRLTQQVVRARLASQAEDLGVLIAILRACCPAETRLPGNWPRLATLGPHVTQLTKYRDSGSLNRRTLSWLLDRIACYLRDGSALFAEAVRWFRLAIEIDTADLGEAHPDTLRSMSNLANTLWNQGDLAGARSLQEKVLEVRRRVLGELHPETLTSMNNLAGTLRSQGDLAGACALEEKVLDVSRRVLGEEHPETLTSMNNLASTLWNQGDLAGARVLQEKVLEVRRRVQGEAHPDTLTSMSNLAIMLGNQGDLAGARALQERVLEVRRRVLGEEHPDTLMSMNNLAGTLRDQGDLAGARTLEEQALEVRRRLLGEAHPTTLTSMNNLAETLGKQGDLAGARALHEQVLEISRRVLGEAHPATLTSMNNLAGTLWNQGDLAGARALQEQVLEVRRRVLGEAHPDTLISMNNLAHMLWRLDEHVPALCWMQRAADGFARVLGREHPKAIATLQFVEEMQAEITQAGIDIEGATS